MRDKESALQTCEHVFHFGIRWKGCISFSSGRRFGNRRLKDTMIRTEAHIRPMRRQEFQVVKRMGRLHFQSCVGSESNGIHDAGG